MAGRCPCPTGRGKSDLEDWSALARSERRTREGLFRRSHKGIRGPRLFRQKERSVLTQISGGDSRTFRALARELVEDKVDVIIAVTEQGAKEDEASWISQFGVV